MSLESFYGGKPGISPVIKKSFKYVNTDDPAYQAKIEKDEEGNIISPDDSEVMETCFAKSNYSDVWYGELAIIDAENRNNLNHGRLYRRTLNRGDTNDLGTQHAEYIGTLAGPAGGFPQTKIVKFNEFKDSVDPEGKSYIYPDSSNSITQGTYDKFVKDIKQQTWNVSADLVPGKNEEGNFNDEVKYYWVNVINEVQGEEKNTIYLGFQIPYPVFDFNIESTDWTNNFSATRIDKQDHPFYTNTKLSIPIGVKGNSVGNFRKEKIEEDSKPVYQYDDFYFSKQGLLMTDEEGNPIHSNDNKVTPINSNNEYKDKQAWLYDLIAYGKFSETIFQKEFTCYLGTVEEIEDIQIADDGIIQVKYLNEDYISINNNNPIRYIKDITYDDTTYKATIKYNTKKDGKNETDSFIIPGITSISIDDNGRISYDTTTSSIPTFQEKPLEFVKNIKIDKDTQEVSIVKAPNTEIKTNVFLKSIQEIKFNDATGDLTIIYNDNSNPVTIKKFRPPLESAEIAAGLYTGLLRAIAIFQEKYYKPDCIDEKLLNDIKNIETTSPSSSTIEAIVRGDWNKNNQSFWVLQKKYFNDSAYFESLKTNELKLKYNILWDESEEEIEEEYFDFYPYDEGKIRFFETQTILWDNLESKDEDVKYETVLNILKLEGNLDSERTGQLLYYKSDAFYYDYNMKQWKYAGTWSSAADKSHIQILQYNTDGDSELIDTGFKPSKAGFYFEQRQILSNEEDENHNILLGEFSNENQTI